MLWQAGSERCTGVGDPRARPGSQQAEHRNQLVGILALSVALGRSQALTVAHRRSHTLTGAHRRSQSLSVENPRVSDAVQGGRARDQGVSKQKAETSW